MKSLRQQYASKQAEATENTQRVLLGSAPGGSDAAKLMAFRDSRARARQLFDSPAAVQAMRAAVEDGDDQLVEAHRCPAKWGPQAERSQT